MLIILNTNQDSSVSTVTVYELCSWNLIPQQLWAFFSLPWGQECMVLYLHSPIRLHGMERSQAQGQLYLLPMMFRLTLRSIQPLIQ